jgi:hypothetical protein
MTVWRGGIQNEPEDKTVCFIAIYRSDKQMIMRHIREFGENQPIAVHELLELAVAHGYPKRFSDDP